MFEFLYLIIYKISNYTSSHKNNSKNVLNAIDVKKKEGINNVH